mgnify:CR=1 FL=1
MRAAQRHVQHVAPELREHLLGHGHDHGHDPEQEALLADSVGLALLVVLTAAGGLVDVDRGLLILMDAILVLVLALLLYSISARDPLEPPGLFDGLQLVLVVAALAVDAVMLTAMLTRIAEFGSSPNKIAALGLNLLLLVHLVRAAWLSAGCLRGRRPFAELERWQTRYLPVYGVWAAIVVLVFPPVFAFA